MFAFLAQLIPLVPRMIETGIATIDAFTKIKDIIKDDRTLTKEERDGLNNAIAEREAVLNDTSRDV